MPSALATSGPALRALLPPTPPPCGLPWGDADGAIPATAASTLQKQQQCMRQDVQRDIHTLLSATKAYAQHRSPPTYSRNNLKVRRGGAPARPPAPCCAHAHTHSAYRHVRRAATHAAMHTATHAGGHTQLPCTHASNRSIWLRPRKQGCTGTRWLHSAWATPSFTVRARLPASAGCNERRCTLPPSTSAPPSPCPRTAKLKALQLEEGRKAAERAAAAAAQLGAEKGERLQAYRQRKEQVGANVLCAPLPRTLVRAHPA